MWRTDCNRCITVYTYDGCLLLLGGQRRCLFQYFSGTSVQIKSEPITLTRSANELSLVTSVRSVCGVHYFRQRGLS